MKISRWIYFPLLYTVLYFSMMFLFFIVLGEPLLSFQFGLWLFNGLLVSFMLLFFSYRKAKKLSNNAADERIHHVRQNRELVVLLDFEKAFSLCREAVLALRKGKIKSENPAAGELKASCRVRWDVPRHKIEFKLKKINENLTEIELRVLPPWKTVVVSSGYSWKIAEDLIKDLREKDAELNKKVLTDSAELLADVYVNPFQKEPVKR
jgi:hypothetical protein